jgi:ABC-2 type transport system permease protein
MMNLSAVYTIWLRELKRYIRSKSTIFGQLIQNFFWFIVFGFGLGAVVVIPGTSNYIVFLGPGIVGVTLLFPSVFSGASVVYDKQFGFLKEVLVAPVPRSSIMLGKTLGGATTSTMQAFVLLLLTSVLGVPIFSNPWIIPISFCILFITANGFVALGVSVATMMKDPQGFQFLMNFLVIPLFLLSGAFFPVKGLPNWLEILVAIDPLAYCIESIRYLVSGSSGFPITTSITVLFGFMVGTILIGSILFRRMEI